MNPSKIKLTRPTIVNKAPQKIGTTFDIVKEPQEKTQVSLQDAALLISQHSAEYVKTAEGESASAVKK